MYAIHSGENNSWVLTKLTLVKKNMQTLPKSQSGTKFLFSYVKEVNGENFQNL